MSHRLISVTEVGALLDCERRHDFAYAGHVLGGHTLRRRNPAITLRRGRAWGRAVAAWHQSGDEASAFAALTLALEDDAREQKDAGVYLEEDHVELLAHLTSLLQHYMATGEQLPITHPELELRVPLPSRTGKRASNRYAFQGFVDGVTREYRLPGLWLVEYKLRDRLMSLEQVAASRQIRWYAWAAERQLGEPVAGVLVDERLNEAPRPARWVNAKRKGEGIDGKVPSHAADQMCTPEAYIAACAKVGIEPVEETRRALAGRDWQKLHPVFLRRSEIEEAGRELVSSGARIAEMDSGSRYPVANRSVFTCPRCPFRSICDDPAGDLTDLDFDLTEPKRLRPQKENEEVRESQPTLAEAVAA